MLVDSLKLINVAKQLPFSLEVMFFPVLEADLQLRPYQKTLRRHFTREGIRSQQSDLNDPN